ncbi:MAG: DNA methyltransferase [Isosphaeraceae bacterium]
MLEKVFRNQAARLPMLFDVQAPGIALRPAPAALKDCFGLLGLNPDTLRKYRIRLKEDETGSAGAELPNPFTAPDALGWAYQYWNTEEKERVFEKVRTVKGAKIAGADIIPATQLYTEDYMVKFLVQNSLGATWMGMHPESKLAENWEYYVKDADRAPVERKPVREITFLDPACGSGHFLLEALDVFYAMYQEEGELTRPEAICDAILTKNLFGIDIDARAVQIAEVALWMKAAERAFDYKGVPTNLVAATASHLKGEAWEQFLSSFQREPSVARVLRKFAQTMEHIDEIGSLARPAEDLREIIRQEHATWERQVRERKEANYLFPEMRDEALSGQLPFHEISDDEFADRLFYRARAGIDAFTERARAAGEFEDQMLGSETRAGFRLVDLLSRRYDVVAANPPYMGSKNMGPALKKYVERNFKAGKRDLYAAFILRNVELAADGGRVAMVTQQSWMFLGSFAELRAIDADKLEQLEEGEFRGLLHDSTVETLAHLGEYGFDDSSAAGAFVAMFTLAATTPPQEHRLTAFRLIGPKSPVEKDHLLRQAVASAESQARNRPQQGRFIAIPQSPMCYWLRERFFELLAGKTLGDIADIPCGPSLGDTERFVRFAWECRRLGVRPGSARWLRFHKGGGYRKWAGFEYWQVEWERDGVRVKNAGLPGTFIRNERFYFREGWVFSSLARGSLGLRLANTGVWGSVMAAPVIPRTPAPVGMIGNSRLATAAVRWMRPQIVLSESYVGRTPVPDVFPELWSRLEVACVRLKSAIVSQYPTESCFEVSFPIYKDFGANHASAVLKGFPIEAALLTLEGVCERLVFAAHRLSTEDEAAILDETGTPTAWFPLITGFDKSTLPAGDLADMPPQDVVASITSHERQNLHNAELAKLRSNLRVLYESGPHGNVELEEDASETGADDEGDDAVAGLRVSIPTETFLEDLSQKLKVHPNSIYWLLKEGIEKEGWRCLPEERRLWADRITVIVLRMLGHRWPKQIEVGELVPDWADPDGIIPLTPLTNESTLFDRVQQRLRADKIDASHFAEVMGKPLDAGLATEFFKHHTKQFKKRPIAWQLQSGKFTARTSPAFACLLYYHKLDADTLPKLRSQYVGPLRQRLETELRGILAVAAQARSDRQEKRRAELDDAIHELTAFDAKLEKVAREGFDTPGLKKLLASEALDRWCSLDGKRPHPTTTVELIGQESAYAPDINDGVRVNIAPLQKAGLLAADVLANKDVDKAIADRAQWRADERRWVREGKLPQPGWWPESGD